MMSRLAHRGPDGEGLCCGEGFCFGHRRLAIIDIEGGAQPMTSDDGRYTLTFNGEIYNYLELRADLIERGVRFRTASDSEVLLQMLIREGPAALDELNGMFAFAFVDRQTGEWLLARDPFGTKPLYYAIRGDELVFASEIKAVLAHPSVEAQSNWKGLQQYLTFQFCLNGETLFEGIRAFGQSSRASIWKAGKRGSPAQFATGTPTTRLTRITRRSISKPASSRCWRIVHAFRCVATFRSAPICPAVSIPV